MTGLSTLIAVLKCLASRYLWDVRSTLVAGLPDIFDVSESSQITPVTRPSDNSRDLEICLRIQIFWRIFCYVSRSDDEGHQRLINEHIFKFT